MKTKHYIKAFTLQEMIVVIILTSVIVGMAFSILSLVQKHMQSIKTNLIANTELDKLEQVLTIDFKSYSNIEYNATNETLNLNTPIDSITYKFGKEQIIKAQDTFNIRIQQKTLYFDGSQVYKGRVDAIKLETTKVLQNQHLFVSKQNDATLFLNI
jgi:type II secretory pathway component PulJ